MLSCAACEPFKPRAWAVAASFKDGGGGGVGGAIKEVTHVRPASTNDLPSGFLTALQGRCDRKAEDEQDHPDKHISLWLCANEEFLRVSRLIHERKRVMSNVP